MTILSDHQWRLKYTPENGDLVQILYVPALSCAVRYDRLTGYFTAPALALAARGVEHLLLNDGHIRLVVGCTLGAAETDAIARGESLKDSVTRTLSATPLAPLDGAMTDALELLAWLVAEGRMEIKVAVPCDENRRPINADGIFHEKAGIIEDKTGDVLAFNGSLNETAAGWTKNYESLNVFLTWREKERVREEAENFGKIWSGRATRVITVDVPTAVRDDLLRFLPQIDKPARVKALEGEQRPVVPVPVPPEPVAPPPPPFDLRKAVWAFIAQAPNLPNGGERVGEVTCPVTPWPHQVRAFNRLYQHWPPKLLIADEVGLGKTIQAGLLLRQAWIAGRAKRILILAPKNVCPQWQIELREKFNLNWPIYDGQKLIWVPSPALEGRSEKSVTNQTWHHEPVVIASSHLVRRSDRAAELLSAEPWDLVILDEAHHARRKGAGTNNESGPNALLKLMRQLKDRTKGLVLLTATPMQVHPVEVFDLLALLGLPQHWTEAAFLRFFEDIGREAPGHDTFDFLASMFRSVEDAYGKVDSADVQKMAGGSSLRAKRILDALRDKASIPRRQLETADRKVALALMGRHSPVNRLVSRHTRDLLRTYYKAGKIKTPIADRRVEDRFIHLSPAERMIYDAVEDYISTTYNQAKAQEKNAVGFVMTIYRRRLASSFHALERTLAAHLEAVQSHATGPMRIDYDEDIDEDVPGEDRDEEEAARLEKEALAAEETSEIERLITMIRRLPPDTKLEMLRSTIGELRMQGYGQVMVFTQFTDTMDMVRRELMRDADLRIMCFSGRGGEVLGSDGSWRRITRDDVKKRFREGTADVLLCTDAAAEGLNFQFCGSLINYDMPWNPMRVEQRIGRIDRLGQKFPDIRIVNLHYADTVEADVYVALRDRIGLFEAVVGRLQPILAKLPTLISGRVLAGKTKPTGDRDALIAEIEIDAERAKDGGFNINAVIDEPDISEPPRPPSPVTLDDLGALAGRQDLLPPGIETSAMEPRVFRMMIPGLPKAIRVTTSASYFDENAGSAELWSPGGAAFVIYDVDPEMKIPNILYLREFLQK